MADDGAASAGKQIPKLLQMLVMGCITIGAVCALQPKYPLWDSFVNTPLIHKTGGPDTNVPLDLVVLSLSYVPLMIITILCRDAGIGKAVMHLKTPYNFVMTLFSAWCFINMAVWRFDPNFAGEAAGNCETALGYEMSLGGVKLGNFTLTAQLFFWSKYIEWIDSVFLLYDNKPISVLHGYHHLGAPIAMGGMVAARAEFVWIFIMWNSFVHTIMYFYFGCSGVGIKLRFIRPYVTSMQIAQFVTGMSYLAYIYNANVFGGKCTTPGRVFALQFQYVYVGSVLCLFSHFFVEQYLNPKEKKAVKEKKVA